MNSGASTRNYNAIAFFLLSEAKYILYSLYTFVAIYVEVVFKTKNGALEKLFINDQQNGQTNKQTNEQALI